MILMVFTKRAKSIHKAAIKLCEGENLTINDIFN